MHFRRHSAARIAAMLWMAAVLLRTSPALTQDDPAPAFTRKPTAFVEGDRVRIEFAVNRPTDVTVAIADGTGVVIRHLVAGLLGPKAPPPLQPNSLEQSLMWDRRDDFGNPTDVRAKNLLVRVSLGLQAKPDRFLAFDPAHLESVRGMACGPNGELYVFDTFGQTHPRDGSTTCKVFSREGKYLRTILPYPAALPDKRLRGLKRLTLPDGSKIPFVCQVETRSFLPGVGDLPCNRPVVTSDGRLGFVGIQEGPRPFAQPGEARFTVIRTDGSIPDEPLRTLISPLTDTGASLALSPDEKTIYAVNVRAGLHPNKPDHLFHCNICDHGMGETWRHSVPLGLLYRFGWDDLQVQVVNNRTPLKEPVSVATDGAGNIYVADVADNRVVVFRPTAMPDGNEVVTGLKRDPGPETIGEIKINSPVQVEVRKATGEIYVLAGTTNLALVKFDGLKNGKVLARTELFRLKRVCPPTRFPTMALDQSADPPIIWIGVQSFWMYRAPGEPVPPVRVTDLRDRFSKPEPLVSGMVTTQERPEGVSPMEISLDRIDNILYVNNFWRYHLARDLWEKLSLPPGLGNADASNHPGFASGAAGQDGHYYVNSAARHAWITRLSTELKMVPFRASLPPDGTPTEQKQGRIIGFLGDHSSGLTADAAGNVYVTWRTAVRGDPPRTRKLYSYTKHGLPRGPNNGLIIDCSVPGLFSPCVDPAGNIYVAAGLRPGKSLLPPGLQGAVPDSVHDPQSVNGVNGYVFICGSIIKFPPSGGVIRSGIGGVSCNYGQGVPIEVKGAEWIVPGASPVSSWGTPRMQPGTYLTCECECPGLDVDGYGRSFYTDACRFRIGVLDTAGNEICLFGVYGNQDSTGPQIALAWPQTVAVGDGWLYVGDRLNRRIACIQLSSTTEAVCRIP